MTLLPLILRLLGLSLPPQDHLAAHLVATVMTLPNGTADNCTHVSQPYGARCVPITCPMFTHEK